MTLTLGFASPQFAFVAGDTRIYSTAYGPDGQPQLRRHITDLAHKVRWLRGGWMVDNLLPAWRDRLDLDHQRADDFAPIRSAVLEVSERMSADVALKSPSHADTIRRERAAWVIAGGETGCELRAVGFDGTDLLVPDVAQVPPEIPEDEFVTTLASAYRELGSALSSGDPVVGAVRVIARFFADVVSRCGPDGSVGPQVEMGLLWRPSRDCILSYHLAAADSVLAASAAHSPHLELVEVVAPDSSALVDATTYKRVTGVASGQVQSASVATGIAISGALSQQVAGSSLYVKAPGIIKQNADISVGSSSNTTILTSSSLPAMTTAGVTMRLTVVGRAKITHAPVAADTLNIRTFIGGTTASTDDICVSDSISGTTNGQDAPFTYVLMLTVKGAGADWIANQLQFMVNAPGGAQGTLQKTSNKIGGSALPSSGGVITVKMQSGSNFATAVVDSVNLEWVSEP